MDNIKVNKEKMIGTENLKNMSVTITYSLDENLQADYKVTSPDDLSYTDFFSAIEKLNVGDLIPDNVEVITRNGTHVCFELAEMHVLTDDKRYIIEWYDYTFEENILGDVYEKKVGNVHREAFRTKEQLRERFYELDAISDEHKIIEAMYECDVKKLDVDDIYDDENSSYELDVVVDGEFPDKIKDIYVHNGSEVLMEFARKYNINLDKFKDVKDSSLVHLKAISNFK
jgi:hypothetical protein